MFTFSGLSLHKRISICKVNHFFCINRNCCKGNIGSFLFCAISRTSFFAYSGLHAFITTKRKDADCPESASLRFEISYLYISRADALWDRCLLVIPLAGYHLEVVAGNGTEVGDGVVAAVDVAESLVK